jgi:hypothetical protein
VSSTLEQLAAGIGPGMGVSPFLKLATAWRQRADELHPYARSAAQAFERAADELEAVLNDRENELLNLKQAADESGYSQDYLGRLVRSGQLPNAGRAHAPKIRRCDLPRKASCVASHPTRAHVAQSGLRSA